MVAACVLSTTLDEPAVWWSEPRAPVPAAVDPLDGLLSPKDASSVTMPATHGMHAVHDVDSPGLPALASSPPAPATNHPRDPPSAGASESEPRAPARPAHFLPPFLDAELSVVRRRAIDLTGPHPRQPPPPSAATPPPARRKRRYASGKLLICRADRRGRAARRAVSGRRRAALARAHAAAAPADARGQRWLWWLGRLGWVTRVSRLCGRDVPRGRDGRFPAACVGAVSRAPAPPVSPASAGVGRVARVPLEHLVDALADGAEALLCAVHERVDAYARRQRCSRVSA